MSAARYSVYLIGTICFVCGFANAAYIEFHPMQVYVIPGTQDIQYARFNDIDLDQALEVLAIDNNRMVLYSRASDSVLYSKAIGPAGTREVIFDDVNRDGIPDVMEGSTDGIGYPSYAMITVVDGSSILLGNPLSQARLFFISQYEEWPSCKLGFLKTVDINLDGKNELVFSYDSAYTFWSGQYQFEGNTRCYYSFPDSLLWRRAVMYWDLWSLGGGAWLAPIYNGFYNFVPPASYGFGTYMEIFNESDAMAPCNGRDTTFPKPITAGGQFSFAIPRCVGDLIPNISGTQILATYLLSTQTIPAGPLEVLTSQLRMYNYDTVSHSLQLIWEYDIGSFPQNILANGGFSGHYLGFVGDTLNLYKGADGSVVYSTTDVPAGRRQWVYPFNDSLPCLAVMNADTVAIYSLTVSTAADGEEDVPIPRRLSIGVPHPNPFNAEQAIPISGKPNSHLTVDIYNLLGQKAARIYDGRVTTPQMIIQWKAEQLSSGIYFIRATNEGESATVKSVLLK